MAILSKTTVTDLTVSGNITLSTAESKKALLDLVYPIGSIYIYQNTGSFPAQCPLAALGGTWELITDKFLFATTSTSGKYGTEGGRKEGYLLKHTHSFSNTIDDSSAGLFYTYNGGEHNHKISLDYNSYDYAASDSTSRHRFNITGKEAGSTINFGTRKISYSDSVLMESAPEHNHGIRIPTDAVKGTTDQPINCINDVHLYDYMISDKSNYQEANMPPYTGVAAWKRTA